jgi:hypothetical protein
MPATTPAEAAGLNATAKFHPHTIGRDDNPDTHPAIEIAGAWVFAYVDPERGLCISVHLEDTEPPLLSEHECVPVEVDLTGGQPVFQADGRGHETYPLLAGRARELRTCAEQVGRMSAAVSGSSLGMLMGDLRSNAHDLADRIAGR